MKKFRYILVINIFLSLLFGKVYDTDKGKIEFVGLEKWDGQDLVDSIYALNPGKPFHPCAGQIQENLDFCKVSCMTYLGDNGDLYHIVKVLEKSNKIDTIMQKNIVFESPILSDYEMMSKILKNRQDIAVYATQSYEFYINKDQEKINEVLTWYGLKQENLLPIWEFIQSQNSNNDFEKALWILNNDTNIYNTYCALLTLFNFYRSDIAWYTLVNLQNHENYFIKDMASIILNYYYTNNSHKIDWSLNMNSITQILYGINPAVYNTTIETLTKTEIDKELIIKILPEIKEFLISHLRLEHEAAKKSAVNFAEYLCGEKNNSNDLIKWLNAQ